MAGTLDQDAVEYLRNSGLDINSTNLNWAMDRLATTPGLRPSLRKQYSTRTEDKIAMNGGISPDDVLGPWDMSAFDPVAAANPNTPSSPRSNKNVGGPKAKAPGNPPMPASKPTGSNEPWAGYGGEFAGQDFHAGPGKAPAYVGHGMAGYVPQNEVYTDPGTSNDLWTKYYDRMYGARDQRIAQGQMTHQDYPSGAGGNPMQNQAQAGEAAPASQDKGWLDWLFGSGPTVNDVRPEGPQFDPAAADALIQAAGGSLAGGVGGATAEGMALPRARGLPAPAPKALPAPNSAGTPVGKPYSTPPGVIQQPGPAAPSRALPRSQAYDNPDLGNYSPKVNFGPTPETPAAAPKSAAPAKPKPAAPSKGEAAADNMLKNSEPKANAKPKASSKSRMKDMTNKKEADAAEKARMDKMKAQGRAKRSYDQQRKSK